MPRVEIPDEFLCCLTLELFVEPVVAADGNTYERSEILKWFKRKQTTSPRTDLPLDDFSLRPNIQLKDAVERFKKCLLSEEAFAAAIKKGDLKTLEARDFLDPRTFSPVRLAVESNQLLVLKYMVGQMHTELVKNNDLLFYARSRPMVQYLVEECKMALEITNKEEQTALEYFCNDRLAIPEEELLAIVAELLRHGADAKPKHKTGGSVFSLLGLPLALVKLLVSAGAAPPELISHVDEFGETFMHAFWSSSEKCAERFPYILSLAGDIPQQIALVSRITKTGCSVVHRCVANPKILKFIFSAPYSLHANVTNKWGSTPIHEWVGYDIPDESLPSLSLLLNEGKCDIDAKRKNNGKTALHLAVSYGRLECVHLLLAAGANTKIVDNEGKCAFDYCTNEKWMRLYRNALSNTTSEFFARYGFVPPVGDWKSSAWQPARSALAAFASAVPAGAAHSASAASAAAGSSVTGHSASAASAPALLAAPSLTVSALSKKRNAEVDPLETGDENESDSKRPTKRANISTENGGSAAATASAVAPSQDKKGEGIITIKVCPCLRVQIEQIFLL
jgi:ankyrin repeat protein